MTVTSTDFPDWNRPLTVTGAAYVTTYSGSLNPGDSIGGTLDASQLNDVVLFLGRLGNGCDIHVGSIVPGAAFNLSDRTALGIGDGAYILLPVQHLGDGLNVGIHNSDTGPQGVDIDVIAFSGANVQHVVSEPFVFTGPNLIVPTAGDSGEQYVYQSCLGDRLTLSVVMDQPGTVTVKRWLADLGAVALVAFPELVMTLAAGVAQTVDVPVGCAGMSFVVANTGGVDATMSFVGRTYRPIGS